MSIAGLLTAGAGCVLAGGGSAAIINGIFNRDGQRAEAAEKLAHAAGEKAETVARDHVLWQEGMDKAYKRIETECEKCNKKLEAISVAFYGLLDDLDELAGEDPRTLRSQVKSAARKARVVVAAHQ